MDSFALAEARLQYYKPKVQGLEEAVDLKNEVVLMQAEELLQLRMLLACARVQAQGPERLGQAEARQTELLSELEEQKRSSKATADRLRQLNDLLSCKIAAQKEVENRLDAVASSKDKII